MNLAPSWVKLLHQHGHEAFHWSTLGNANAPDQSILTWATKNKAVIMTADLDFSALLATQNLSYPSVIQLRVEVALPRFLGTTVLQILETMKPELEQGVLIVVSESKIRSRQLPFAGESETGS
jgi:predicted nuclease of predicted toxin-antitoxin system